VLSEQLIYALHVELEILARCMARKPSPHYKQAINIYMVRTLKTTQSVTLLTIDFVILFIKFFINFLSIFYQFCQLIQTSMPALRTIL
jgi:hypothetical protein